MKLSIITINKNNAIGLEKTIKSVIEQSYSDYEFIVIDGASNDESIKIIKKYSTKISYWLSEPDLGIYNAMNKGIKKAIGEYCLFLNSGDWLIDNNTLSALFMELSNTEDAGVYYTCCLATNKVFFKPPENIDINYLVIHNLNHQNSLIKRLLFLEHGFYNEDFSIASDYEFWLKEFWLHETKFKYINTSIAIYDSLGISSHSNFDHELEGSIRNLFGPLAESLIKLRHFQHSLYGSILENYGYSKLLNFLLRLSRFLYKITGKKAKKGMHTYVK